MQKMVYQKKPDNLVLAQGFYLNYDYCVKSLGTHPVAYVKIPESYPIHSWDDFDDNITVHGGITFHSLGGIYVDIHGTKLEGEWIGWDYAHAGDKSGYLDDPTAKSWTTEEMVADCKWVIGQLIRMADKLN